MTFQHVGSRGLLLQRIAQFVEQAARSRWRYRLGGESCRQLDMFSSNGSNLTATEHDHTDRLAVSQERHAKVSTSNPPQMLTSSKRYRGSARTSAI